VKEGLFSGENRRKYSENWCTSTIKIRQIQHLLFRGFIRKINMLSIKEGQKTEKLYTHTKKKKVIAPYRQVQTVF
jgi:ribosomal protein S8